MERIRIPVFLMCLGALFFTTGMYAQESGTSDSKVSFDFGADLMSRYVWRGTQFGGTSPSLQPGLSVGIAGLEIGAWGAYSLGGNNTDQEFDLYLSYTFLNDLLSITVTDYFFPEEGADYNYTQWNKDETGHLLEGTISFNGNENLPIRFMAAFNFYGNDAITLNGDGTKKGIQYSNYFETGFTFNANNISCDAFLGGTLSSPDEDLNETGFYGTGPGIVNLGFTASKEIEITDSYSLPITASVITNPQAGKVFFVFGFSF
ncbi:MAG: hypothetical protein IH591_09205 [Bacteroidales bacterium]|nr:hypothetical protein [Bacteroidales bacterium]